jgi:hypothetical protein
LDSVTILFVLGIVAFFGWWIYEFSPIILPLETFFKNKDQIKSDDLNGYQSKFDKSPFQKTWLNYQKNFIQLPQGKKSLIPAQQFFNLNEVIGIENIKRWQSYANIMLGLGILGTFVGLTSGLVGFNLENSDIDSIKNNINSLIPGMRTAFITSIAGMSFSLLTNFLQRLKFKKLDTHIQELIHELDQFFLLSQQQEQSLYYTFKNPQGGLFYPAQFMQMMLAQSEELQDWNKINSSTWLTKFNQYQEDSKLILEDILDIYQNDFHSKTGDGKDLNPIRFMNHSLILMQNQLKMKAAINQQLETYHSEFLQFKDELKNEFREKFIFQTEAEQEVFPSEFMRDILSESREQTTGIKRFTTDLAEGIILSAETLDALAERFEQALTNPIQNHLVPVLADVKLAVEELRTEKQESIGEFISKVTDQFTDSLSGIADKLEDSLTKATRERLEGLALQLAEAGKVFEKIPETIEAQITSSQEILKTLTQELHQEIQNQQLTVKALTEEMTEHAREIMLDLKTEFSQEIQTQQLALKNLTQEITENNRQIMTELKNEISQEIAKQQEVLQNFTLQLQDATLSATKNLQSVLKQLEEQQLTSSQAIQGVLDSTGTMLNTLEKSVENIHNAMVDMDDSLKDMGKIAKALSNTSQAIENTGQTLEKITSAFVSDSGDIYVKNQKTLEEVLRTLERSTQMTEVYVEQFSTIKQGLTQIFADLLEGLSHYREASRETLNNYLGDFSEHLTGATKTLSGSVSGIREMVEDIEMIHQQMPQSLKGIETLSLRIAQAGESLPISLQQFADVSKELQNWANKLSEKPIQVSIQELNSEMDKTA